MGSLGIRKASEVAVPASPAYLSSVCATSTGVEAMASNTIFGENNPFVESANQRWLAKKNGIYHYGKQDIQQIKKGTDYFQLQKNIQIGCSVHQLDRPHALIV